MKKVIFLFCAVVLAGCSSNYLENPQYFVQDPHFESYQTKKDAIEKQYLDKKITYADYLEQVKALDETYSKEVKERESVVITGGK